MSSIQRGASGGVGKDEEQQVAAAEAGVLEIGKKVPDFKLSCVDGQEHKLSDFLGTKVLLCFYRYSRCPLCAYTFGKLMGNYKKLAWASKLKVITVFRTDLASLKQGLTSGDAPIARLCDDSLYPFLALADPNGEAGSAFQLEYRHGLRQTLDMLPHYMELARYHKNCNAFFISPASVRESSFNVEGADSILPSELLIDEHGILVDILRTTKSIESLTMDRISHFLLLGSRLPDDHGCIGKKGGEEKRNAV